MECTFCKRAAVERVNLQVTAEILGVKTKRLMDHFHTRSPFIDVCRSCGLIQS